MHRNPPVVSAGGSILTLCALVNAILLEQAYTGKYGFYRLVPFTLTLFILVFIGSRIRMVVSAAKASTPFKPQTL